jgi:hypothetical protein
MKKKLFRVKNIKTVFAFSMLTLVAVSCKKEDVTKVTDTLDTSISIVDFEDITIGEKGYVDSVGNTNQFDSKNFIFQCQYDTSYHSFSSGFALSTLKDTVTAGYENMYSVYAGIGGGDSKAFVIGTNNAKIICPAKKPELTSVDITNTTYAALAMKDGYYVATKFSKGDFFKLTIQGYLGGVVKDSVEVYLADFRSENAADHFIQKSWKSVQLSKVSNTDSLVFKLTSSDNGLYGMNTPGFFALDNLKAKY